MRQRQPIQFQTFGLDGPINEGLRTVVIAAGNSQLKHHANLTFRIGISLGNTDIEILKIALSATCQPTFQTPNRSPEKRYWLELLSWKLKISNKAPFMSTRG